MTQILEEFDIERPCGLTKEANAQLLVNKMPRPVLMRLLNEAVLPPAPEGESETCDDKAAEAAEEVDAATSRGVLVPRRKRM